MKRFILAITTFTLLGCSHTPGLIQADSNQQVVVQDSQNPVDEGLSDAKFARLFPKPVAGNKWFYKSYKGQGSEDGTSAGMHWKMSIEITEVKNNKVTALIKSEPLDSKATGKNQVITDSINKFWKTMTLALYTIHSKPISNVSKSCGTLPGEECPLTDLQVPAGNFKVSNVTSGYMAHEEVYNNIGSPPVNVNTIAHTEINIAPNVGIIEVKGETRYEYDKINYFVDTNLKLSSYKISR